MGFFNPSPIIGAVLIFLFISLLVLFFYALSQKGDKFKATFSMIIFATVGFQLFHVLNMVCNWAIGFLILTQSPG